jgi:hypothetical protein
MEHHLVSFRPFREGYIRGYWESIQY